MWKHKNFINLQLCATFKHFYDAGTIGSGTVKFRHYSQQEPSSGNVIKAGTYRWIDTPAIEELNNITGSTDNSFIGKFKSSNITFDEIYTSGIRVFKIGYLPSQNFVSLAEFLEEGEEVDEVGYQNGEWYISGTFSYYAQEPSLQTFAILEDIDLSEWNDTEIEQAILSWFTANTTKLS